MNEIPTEHKPGTFDTDYCFACGAKWPCEPELARLVDIRKDEDKKRPNKYRYRDTPLEHPTDSPPKKSHSGEHPAH